MSLFEQIHRISQRWDFFNSRELSADDLVTWANSLGIRVEHERRVKTGMNLFLDGKETILYNPWLSPSETVLVLGHELGHYLLGNHRVKNGRSPSRAEIYNGNRQERDASVIGFLCLMPTRDLLKMCSQQRLTPEELYAEHIHLWGDLGEEAGWKTCVERIAIFRDLRNI